MYVKTDRFAVDDTLEAIADYERWLAEPDDERPNIWSITEPSPGRDLTSWQQRLDAIGGFEAHLPRLRIVWAGTLFQRIEGVERLQYPLPVVAEAQAKVLRVGDDEWELPFDESKWEPEMRERLAAGAVLGVKDYIVERAIPLYCIQELVPGRHANKNRDDNRLDASDGIYQLVHWISTDDTDRGAYREPNDHDIEVVRHGWEARLRELPHRPDEDTPATYTRKRVRERMRALKAQSVRHRQPTAVELEESRERLIKRVMDLNQATDGRLGAASDKRIFLPVMGAK